MGATLPSTAAPHCLYRKNKANWKRSCNRNPWRWPGSAEDPKSCSSFFCCCGCGRVTSCVALLTRRPELRGVFTYDSHLRSLLTYSGPLLTRDTNHEISSTEKRGKKCEECNEQINLEVKTVFSVLFLSRLRLINLMVHPCFSHTSVFHEAAIHIIMYIF